MGAREPEPRRSIVEIREAKLARMVKRRLCDAEPRGAIWKVWMPEHQTMFLWNPSSDQWHDELGVKRRGRGLDDLVAAARTLP